MKIISVICASRLYITKILHFCSTEKKWEKIYNRRWDDCVPRQTHLLWSSWCDFHYSILKISTRALNLLEEFHILIDHRTDRCTHTHTHKPKHYSVYSYESNRLMTGRPAQYCKYAQCRLPNMCRWPVCCVSSFNDARMHGSDGISNTILLVSLRRMKSMQLRRLFYQMILLYTYHTGLLHHGRRMHPLYF